MVVTIAYNSLILVGVRTVWQRVVIGVIILIGTGIPAYQERRALKHASRAVEA